MNEQNIDMMYSNNSNNNSNPISRVTYHPLTKKFYIGSVQNTDFSHDEGLDPIRSVDWNKDLGQGRYKILNAELYRTAERHLAQGAIDSPSISVITTTDLLEQVIGKEYRQFFAIQSTTRIPVPRLTLDFMTSTKYNADEKVPEMEEPSLKAESFTKTSFALWKNAIHIAASDETSLKANVEPLQYNISQAAGSLGKAANGQIVKKIETFGDSARSDWGARNTNADFSANNPLDDIQAVHTTVANNHYLPDTITMHPKVWGNYISNTFINGIAPAIDRQNVGVFMLPKWPGITAIIDVDFSNTKATLYDKRAMLFGEGPTVAEQYRNAAVGYNAWIIRQWLEPVMADTKAGKVMTGVAS